MTVEVKIKTNFLYDNITLPQYETDGSAGFDLSANIAQAVMIRPGQVSIIDTGVFVAIPLGYELQIRPRSGLAATHGITVVNSPGTIDSDYRGEIKVILTTFSDLPYQITPGDRIAQAVLKRVEQARFTEVDELDETDRGAGGFGSTGKK